MVDVGRCGDQTNIEQYSFQDIALDTQGLQEQAQYRTESSTVLGCITDRTSSRTPPESSQVQNIEPKHMRVHVRYRKQKASDSVCELYREYSSQTHTHGYKAITEYRRLAIPQGKQRKNIEDQDKRYRRQDKHAQLQGNDGVKKKKKQGSKLDM